MYNVCFWFESGHFMIILFGYFPGYSYVKQVMENMNIEDGEVCDSYIESLSAKQLQDKERKSTKKFKHQRRKLLLARRAKSKQSEKREGITYGSGIASELGELQDEVWDIIKNVTIADAETSAKDASLPATRAPPQLAGKPAPNSTIVYFDLETSSRAKDCEIVQIAVVSRQSSFVRYITPSTGIAPSATAVHGLRIAYDQNGNRCLSKKGTLVASSSREEAFDDLLSHLDTIQHPCVLVGHNSAKFDIPRLMYQLRFCERQLCRALDMPLYFGDSLAALRKVSWLNKSKALGSVYQDITGKTFDAHDALEDATALQVIMEDQVVPVYHP